MFERMVERAHRKAECRAETLVLELTERLRAELPGGIRAEAARGGVRLTGGSLKRRFALEPALRWMRFK
jgi:hypothetical protein